MMDVEAGIITTGVCSLFTLTILTGFTNWILIVLIIDTIITGSVDETLFGMTMFITALFLFSEI
jgi:hypothetical protein